MRHTNKTSLLTLSYLLLSLLWISCSSDTDDEVAEIFEETNLGDATLNRLIITSEEEQLVTVDPATGEARVVYEFDRFVELVGLADYHNGTVYVATKDNAVNAIDLNSQRFRWDVPMPEYEFSALSNATTVYDDGLVYCLGYLGVVVAVEATTGNPVWMYSVSPSGDPTDRYLSGGIPIVHGDRLYVLVEDNIFGDPAYLHVLDKKTGERLGRLELPYDYSGTLAFAGNTLLLPAGNLYALDEATLDLIWEVEFEGVSTPAVSGDKVVVHAVPSSDDNLTSFIYGLDLATGAIQWQQEAGFDRFRGPLVVGDVVFAVFEKAKQVAGIRNGRPMALRASTGELLWRNDDINIKGWPTFANGRLYFHGYEILSDRDDGQGFMCLDAATGALVWLNEAFGYGSAIPPLVVADNGVFGPGQYAP